MEISGRGLDLIRRFEGLSLLAYPDAAGKMTIGYGHLVLMGENFPPEGISKAAAESLLMRDARKAAFAVERNCPELDGQNRFDALCSFVFNVGAGAFARSTLRRVINAGWHMEAEQQFMRWVLAGGRRLPGLVARRQAEAALYAET